jgi:hypothetical protein
MACRLSAASQVCSILEKVNRAAMPARTTIIAFAAHLDDGSSMKALVARPV